MGMRPSAGRKTAAITPVITPVAGAAGDGSLTGRTYVVATALAGPLEAITDAACAALGIDAGELRALCDAGARYSPLTRSLWLPDAPPSRCVIHARAPKRARVRR